MSIGLLQGDKGGEGDNGYSPSFGSKKKEGETAFRYRMAASFLDLNAGEDQQLSNNDHAASATCKMFDLNGFS